MGPDGSLCRITSSAKDLINNVRIIKVPDSEPSYKLVVIRPNDERKELSEESDEELSDNEICDIQFPPKSIEKENVMDSKIDKLDKPNEIVSKEIVKKPNYYNKNRRYNKRNNNRFPGRRNNNFNKISRKCENISNMEGIYNYGNRDFNSPANQDFSSAVNHAVAYISPVQPSSNDIPPWIDTPVLHNNYPCTSFPHVQLPETPRNSVGLLGHHPPYAPPLPIHDQNSPYSFMPSNFASNNLNNRFIHEQNSSYSQMTSNYPSSKQTDNFIRDQKYWNGNYGNYNKNNQRGGKNHLNDTNKRRQNGWNKKPRRHSNVRNNKSFDYRN